MYKFGRSLFPNIGSGVFAAGVRSWLVIVSLVFLSGLTASGLLAQEAAPQTEDQRETREAIHQGVRAFKNRQYGEAINEFQRAKLLDRKRMNARLYLATV